MLRWYRPGPGGWGGRANISSQTARPKTIASRYRYRGFVNVARPAVDPTCTSPASWRSACLPTTSPAEGFRSSPSQRRASAPLVRVCGDGPLQQCRPVAGAGHGRAGGVASRRRPVPLSRRLQPEVGRGVVVWTWVLTGFPPPSQQLLLRNHTACTAPAACAGVILLQRESNTAANMMLWGAIFPAVATHVLALLPVRGTA